MSWLAIEFGHLLPWARWRKDAFRQRFIAAVRREQALTKPDRGAT